jgi:hypothetical protein
MGAGRREVLVGEICGIFFWRGGDEEFGVFAGVFGGNWLLDVVF